MTPDQMKAWRRRLKLTQTEAGAPHRLDLTTRAVCYYETGGRPIPRVVELACWAIEHPGKDFPRRPAQADLPGRIG